MDNYSVKINNFDEDDEFGLFEIIFTNIDGKKIASFDLYLYEITKGYGIENFNKLTDIDKAIMLKKFSHNVGAHIDSEINFVMTNGIIYIKILNGFMEFKITCMCSNCEFVVVINEQLINEFQQKIYYPLIEKFQLDE